MSEMVVNKPDVDVKNLTLQLLSSPQNLDFALDHQSSKVKELQLKMQELVHQGDVSQTTHQGNVSQITHQGDVSQTTTQGNVSQATTQITHQGDVSQTTPHNKGVAEQKAAPKPRRSQHPNNAHLQLPPSFKYPEPVDVLPISVVNGVALYAEHRSISPPSSNNSSDNEHMVRGNGARFLTPSPAAPVPGFLAASPSTGNGLNLLSGATPAERCKIPVVQKPLVSLTSPLVSSNLSLQSFANIPQSFPNLSNLRSLGNLQKLSNLQNFPPSNNLHSFPASGKFEASPLQTALSSMKQSFKKPKLEIVVGDLKDFDPKLLNTTLWDSSEPAGQHIQVQGKGIIRKRRNSQNRTFDEHHPGKRSLYAEWKSLPKNTPYNLGKAGSGPFLHWKLNAVEFTSKVRRCRTKIEPEMLDLLESKYQTSHFVTPYERKQLAQALGITERAVIYWFQNRRRKDIKNLNNMGNDIKNYQGTIMGQASEINNLNNLEHGFKDLCGTEQSPMS